MKAELVLSRSNYRVGTPVVGTVRIHDNDKNSQSPIRDDLASARLYLAGRSYLGNKHKVSKWRSGQEISNLQKFYGEDGHACLRMARMEEMALWRRDEMREKGRINWSNQPPDVSHIEQAERLAIYLYLYPKYNQRSSEGAKDYSHLPTLAQNSTICFFMTNVLELLDVPERDGSCAMDPFQPLQLPHLRAFRDGSKQGIDNDLDEDYRDDHEEESLDSSSYSSSLEDPEEEYEPHQHSDKSFRNAPTSSLPTWKQIMSTTEAHNNSASRHEERKHEERNQISLSFRTELPFELPPTMAAECIKYFYSAVLAVTTTSGELLVATCPFVVLTEHSPYLEPQISLRDAATVRVHVGELRAVAHSRGLPTLISSTDTSKLPQLNAIANPPARSILSRRVAEQQTSTHTIRDSNGALCGWMTLIGVGKPISAGSRLAVCVAFPNMYSGEHFSTNIIGCHRVCCGLVGEEYAIGETSNSTTSKNDDRPSAKSKRKTRSYVFDSAYEMVEFGHTDRITMDLLLPSHCPITITTDLVEITVTLKVEFTVDSKSNSSGTNSNGLGVINLDLPCEVVHSGIGLNEDPEDNEEGEKSVSTTFRSDTNKDFAETDLPDLNVLSFEMMKSFAS